MATSFGLNLSAEILRGISSGELTRSSFDKKKDYTKTNLIEMIMSLACVLEMSGTKKLIIDVAAITRASPSKGGGWDNARSALLEGQVQETAAAVRARSTPNVASPPQEAKDTAIVAGASVGDGSLVNDDNHSSTTKEQEGATGRATTEMVTAPCASTGDGSLANGENEGGIAKLEATGGATRKTPPVCKTYYKGNRCDDNECQRLHPQLCNKPSCTGGKHSTCKLWHLVKQKKMGAINKPKPDSKPKPKANQGNSRRGRRPSSPTMADFMGVVKALTSRPVPAAVPLAQPMPMSAAPSQAWPPLPTQAQLPLQTVPAADHSGLAQPELTRLQEELARISKAVQSLGARLGALA